jgi:uncharacterized membrane protein
MEHPRPQGATMSDLNTAATPDVNTAAPPDVNSSGLSYNAAAGIAYLTIIPAIVFLIIEPFKKNAYVRFHAWQSIFFFVAWAVVNILVGLVQHIVPSAIFLTLTALQLVGLALFIVWLIVFIAAFGGKRIKLPVIGDLAARQAER